MTTESSLGSRTIGEIAAILPGATVIFRRLKLNFCCGGDVMLADALRERGLDIGFVERTLAALDPSKSAPAPDATGALIDHILTRYREAHRRWEALYVGTDKLVDDVMEHIHLENNVLFPRFEHREAA